MGHTEDVLDLRWTHDSRFLVSSGMDKRIFIWNVEKKYHVKVPVQHKVDENSAKASYKNGVLEIVFKLVEEEKPKGKTVEVE